MQLTVEPEEHDPAALDLPRIVEKSKKTCLSGEKVIDVGGRGTKRHHASSMLLCPLRAIHRESYDRECPTGGR